MKKTLIVFALVALVVSCGNNNEGAKEPGGAPAETAAEATDPEAEKGLELVAKSDCFTCHKVDEASTGPSYTAVAEKYGKDDKTIDDLAQKIIKGGSGNWGTVPMVPHPGLSEEDAKTMVRYILSLKK